MVCFRSLVAFALVSLSSVFATGCIADTDDTSGIVWYDDGLDACFSYDKAGKTVQVPCEGSGMPGLTEQDNFGAACTGSACCDATLFDEGLCK